MLRKIRIAIAAAMLAAATLLFLDVSGSLHRWLSWIAKIQFLPALMALNVAVLIAIIIVTALFGRVYCSIVCPLGIMQDAMARIGRMAKKNRYAFSKAKTTLRWLMRSCSASAVSSRSSHHTAHSVA